MRNRQSDSFSFSKIKSDFLEARAEDSLVSHLEMKIDKRFAYRLGKELREPILVFDHPLSRQ
jgi:hypothetical protein